MIEPRSCLLSNVFSPCLGPDLGTCLCSRDARSHLCAFGDPVKRVMPVDLPGRSDFWVREIQQVVEVQKKTVERGDEIAAVTHRHGGEQTEGG